jgi:hypothetical protein
MTYIHRKKEKKGAERKATKKQKKNKHRLFPFILPLIERRL